MSPFLRIFFFTQLNLDGAVMKEENNNGNQELILQVFGLCLVPSSIEWLSCMCLFQLLHFSMYFKLQLYYEIACIIFCTEALPSFIHLRVFRMPLKVKERGAAEWSTRQDEITPTTTTTPPF